MANVFSGFWQRITLGLGVLMLLSNVHAVKAEQDVDAAQAMIENVGQEFLSVLGPDGIKDEQQLDKLTSLLEEAINLNTTGRLILAKNWRTASEEQQQTYLDLFAPYVLDNLASKIRASSAETPLESFTVAKSEAIGKNDVLVSTDLFWPGYPPYRLDWRLRGQDDGHFRAIDVVVEGVSMVVTQRAEFASVIERRGMDGLLDRMRNQVGRQL